MSYFETNFDGNLIICGSTVFAFCCRKLYDNVRSHTALVARDEIILNGHQRMVSYIGCPYCGRKNLLRSKKEYVREFVKRKHIRQVLAALQGYTNRLKDLLRLSEKTGEEVAEIMDDPESRGRLIYMTDPQRNVLRSMTALGIDMGRLIDI